MRSFSYAVDATGHSGSLVVPHERYMALGVTPSARQMACRELFRAALEPDQVHDI